MNITILSRKQAEFLIQNGEFPENTAVITFYNPDDAHVDYSTCHDQKLVYYCPLDDIDLSTLQNRGLTFEQYFDYADDIAAFIYEAYQKNKNLICQCDYGQSRSAGCAAAIQQHFYQNGIDIFADYRYYPNQMVYHKIFDALQEYKNQITPHSNSSATTDQ